MKQKGILIIGVLAIIAIVGSVIFAYTRNNVAVETMAELTITQEQLDSMTAQYNDIQTQLEEAQEEVESLKNSNEQKQNEIDSLTDQNTELQENLTSLQVDLEEEKAKAKTEVADTEKVEEVKKEETTTSQQTTETAPAQQSAPSSWEEAAQLWGIEGEHVVERDMSGQPRLEFE